MPKITSKQVKDFWKYMGRAYRFKVIDKSNATEMRIVGWALDMMGIQNRKNFLKNFTTTVGNRVYIPFEIGKGTQRQLVQQVITCTHEAQHVAQYRRDHSFLLKYLLSDSSRALYEADAYRTNMEIYWWFYKKLLSPGMLANKLKSYSVGKSDIRVVKKHLLSASKTVKYGGVITGTSKKAIRWLNRNVKTSRPRRVTMIRV